MARNMLWNAVVSLGILGLSMSGCGGRHTIEPGTWRLRFETDKSDSKKFVPKPKDVAVVVDWSEEEKGVETLRASFQSRNDSQMVDRILDGTIREGRVELEGKDQDWVIKLWGKVLAPDSMSGTAFARSKNYADDQTYFEGVWSMTKAKPME